MNKLGVFRGALLPWKNHRATHTNECTFLPHNRHRIVHSYESTSSQRHVIVCMQRSSQNNSTKKQSNKGSLNRYIPPSKEEAALRAEAEAPFRSVRVVLFGFGTVSAVLANLFSIPQIIGALANAPNAKSLFEAGQDVGINITALLLCLFFLQRDLQAREKQMARLLREDQLGACQIELANKRILRLGQLRGAARPVIIVGTHEQVSEAMRAAEEYKQALTERGVIILGVPLYSTTSSDGNPAMTLTSDELRWKALPIRLDEWKKWFDEQTSASNTDITAGLYIGLRMDGRVRASGKGCPPWGAFAAQLPPIEGFFGGFLDGMDGRV